MRRLLKSRALSRPIKPPVEPALEQPEKIISPTAAAIHPRSCPKSCRIASPSMKILPARHYQRPFGRVKPAGAPRKGRSV